MIFTTALDVISNENYFNDLLIAKKAGYFIGLPDGTVMPNGYMSRQEYALIISRLLKLDTAKYIDKANKFKDASDIPGWSKGAIGAVANAGYMQGEPGSVYNPKGFITRGQAVAVLSRCYLDKVKIAYNKPGTYSPTVIDGSAEIDVPDVKLENTTINGNLIIGKGVGDGTVRLKNVTVKGDTIVKGGGLNSVIIEDSQIKNIIILKEDNKVRILAVGSTSVEQVDMQSGAKLEEQGITGTGFGYVTIAESVDSNEPIILMGNFDSVQIQSSAVKLDVAAGNIAKIDIAPTAVNTHINLAEGVNVKEMIVAAKAEVTGKGTIETAEVKAQDTIITVPTTTIKTAEGVTVATSSPTPAPVPTQSTGGSSSGSSGSSSQNDNNANISVSSIAVTGTGNASTITTDNGTLQMLASVIPANATNKTVTWSVTNGTGTANISSSGLLKAVSNGTVTVRATANDGSGKYGVKVITISNQLPTIIYTSSTIANGAVDPGIVVNLINDTFTADGVSSLPANWTSSSGTTGLTVGTVTRNSNTQMTLHLTGTAIPGIFTLKAKAAAFTGDIESNTISVFVLPVSSGETGTIEPAETINGGENAEPNVTGQSITFNGEIAYYAADVYSLPVSANWVGVKITAPAGVTPDGNAVFYVNGRNSNRGEISGWSNIIEEGDGANYFHLYQRITDLSRVYNIVIKWNNEITEAYSINFSPSATLEPKHGTIERAETINGGVNATTTTAGRNITFRGEIGYITGDANNGLPVSGNWVGVKITAPEGVYPDENAVLTAHGTICNRNGEPGWENIREPGDGDNYFYLYQRVKITSYVYEIEIKWNNEVTETYSIIIPRTTTLEYSSLELEKLVNMITYAQTIYDNAVLNGSINPGYIAEFGGAIAAAESVNTGATMQQIYAAQDQLAAAMNKFEAAVFVQQEADKITVDALGTITTTDTQTILEKAQALVSPGYNVIVKEADGTKINAEGKALEAGEGAIRFTVAKDTEPSNTADTAILNITVQ